MKIDISKDSLGKLILWYGLPSIVTMWIFALYTIVDGIFIGKFLGGKELAAVNIIMPYVNFSFALGIMIAVGGGTIIAISLGEENYKRANKIFSLSLELFLILGGILGGLGIFFPEKLAKILGANDVILEDATTYLFYISFFTIFYLLSYGLEVFIRIDGNTTYSLTCITIGAVLNILLDYIFILKLNMGIMGAGLATGLAQLGTALALLHYIAFRTKKLNFSFTKIHIKEVFKICYNGSSEFLTEIATGIIIMVFNIKIMGIIGERGVSAFGIIGYISTLVTMTMIGFSQGIQPLISFNYGSKNYKKIKSILKIGITSVICLGIFFFSIVNIFNDSIIGAFIKNDMTLYLITENAMRLYSFTYIIMGVNIIISSYFTAIENAFLSSLLSIFRGIIFMNTFLYILPKIFGNNGIWITSPINEITTLILSIIIFINYGIKKIEI